MSKEKRVKDIMRSIEALTAIMPDATIRSALGSFQKPLDGAAESLLVVNGSNSESREVIGFLGLEDIVRGMESFMVEDSAVTDSTPPIFWEGLFTEECKNELEKQVRELMTPIEVTVNKNDNLMKALHMMDSCNLRRVLVVEGQKAVGVVRLEDIFEQIAFIARETP
ncbi:MAG: CBS domain-containing protein [Pseudomonadota bacterium]